MCMHISATDTIRLRRRLDRMQKDSVEVYKVLYVRNGITGKVTSPHFISCKWKPGVKESVYRASSLANNVVSPGLINNGRVTKGIHVFMNKKQAEKYAKNLIGHDGMMVVVKLTAQKEDLIAAGTNGRACFTKVTLAEAEYAKIVNTNLKRLYYKNVTV